MKANNPDTPVTEVDQHPSFMHVTRNRSQSNPSSSQQLLLASSVTALQLLSISRSLLRSALSASSHSGQWQNSHWPPEQQDEACSAKPILLKAHRAEPWHKQAAWHRGSCFSCTKEKKISSPTAVPEAQAYLLQQRGTGPGSYQILFYYFSDVCNSRCGADRLCWTFIWHFRISIEITVFDKKKTASAVWARTCGPGSSTVWMKRGLLIETLASLFLRQHCWAPLLNLPPSPYPILGSKSHENPQHPAKLSRANLSVQSAGVLQCPGYVWRGCSAAQCARFWAPRSLLWPPSQYYPKQSRTVLPAGSALQWAPGAVALPGPSHRSRNPPAAGGRSTSSHGTSAREMTGRKSSGSRAWAKRRRRRLEPQKTAIITAPLRPLTHCTTQLRVAGEIHLGRTQIKC